MTLKKLIAIDHLHRCVDTVAILNKYYDLLEEGGILQISFPKGLLQYNDPHCKKLITTEMLKCFTSDNSDKEFKKFRAYSETGSGSTIIVRLMK